METENKGLVKRETPPSFIERLIEHAEDLEKIKEVGMVIINSGFCPQHFKDSKDAVGAIMCIEAGRKLGLTWMQSLSDIYPVKGRIGIMGTAAKAVIFASGILESWSETTEGEYPQAGYKHITISKRKDLPNEFRTEFSVFDAQTAGLMGKDIYKKYGKRMIAWRDIGFHASDYYQDILKGMKTVEELNDYDGLVPGTPEKITLKTEDGKEITFTDQDKAHSKKTTSRVANKIPDNKFGEVKKDNIQDAEVVNEDPKNVPEEYTERNKVAVESRPGYEPDKKDESPFKADKGSVEYLDGKEVKRDTAGDIITDENKEPKYGDLTLEVMEKMDTAILLKTVMEDMDMMEGCETIGGKNTNLKLRKIIFAHQEGKLAEHVAPYLKANEEREKQEAASTVNTQTGEIPINKAFDKATEDKKIDAFLSKTPVKKEEPAVKSGNKYGIPVSETVPRDFSEVKQIFNKMMGVTPQITTPRYMELSAKLGLDKLYADKETFIKQASVNEINILLNAN